LQPGDSRDVVVDVLSVLIQNKNKELASEEIRNLVIKLRKKSKLQMRGIASSNIRRQLRRLRELFLIEKVKNNYRITEFDSLINTFEEKIEKYYLSSILERVRDYFKAIK
jgi:predicted transcriptional regulator